MRNHQAVELDLDQSVHLGATVERGVGKPDLHGSAKDGQHQQEDKGAHRKTKEVITAYSV